MKGFFHTALFALSPLLFISAPAVGADVSCDFGADLRIRQEMMGNVPGNPNGGLVKTACGDFADHVRFRPRVWGELKLATEESGVFRLYTRLADEFRWNVEPYKSATSWPGEVILDNLFLEGKGLFDGLLDFRFGRQDLFGYCKLNHIFVDGTPGDGSRSIYTDMAAVTLHVDEDHDLDLFGLYDLDNAKDLRWGYDHQRFSSLAARFPNGEGNQDDWGYGAIWTSRASKAMPWQVFAVQKRLRKPGGERNHTELVGFKLMPKWNDGLSSDIELMSELNQEWSAYADLAWKSTREGVRPFANLSYHFFSKEWDPMWARAVNDSEMFLYGTHNGVAWWSNMHLVKLAGGLDFGKYRSLTVSTGPIFAAEADGVGGGNGFFKGELSQVKYSFPVFTNAMRSQPSRGEQGRGLEIFGHIIFEHFQPGDYYESRRGAWFFRWQLEFKF